MGSIRSHLKTIHTGMHTIRSWRQEGAFVFNQLDFANWKTTEGALVSLQTFDCLKLHSQHQRAGVGVRNASGANAQNLGKQCESIKAAQISIKVRLLS